MMAPVPPRPPDRGQHHTRQFLLGAGLGAVPLIVALVGVYMVTFVGGANSGAGLIAGVALYLAAIIAMIVCLSIARVRFVGYGLLAAVAASPVIFGVGCIVILSQPR
jgi:hypothetical protein